VLRRLAAGGPLVPVRAGAGSKRCKRACAQLVASATHESMLEYAPLAELKKYAVDLN